MVSTPGKRSTNVRLTPIVYGWLRDYAHDENLSQSEVIESVLRQFMEDHLTSKRRNRTETS